MAVIVGSPGFRMSASPRQRPKGRAEGPYSPGWDHRSGPVTGWTRSGGLAFRFFAASVTPGQAWGTVVGSWGGRAARRIERGSMVDAAHLENPGMTGSVRTGDP
jgi:hypothetical protein